MIFNSLTFILFLSVVVTLFWALPKSPRLWLIFLASITFYGFWRWEFVPLLLVSSTTDYLVARKLGSARNAGVRRLLVAISLSINLGLLFVFKYLIFFTDNLNHLASWTGIELPISSLGIILPLGISFYTFQTISYTIDVYRGFVKPEKSYVLYSCYVMFFPQLIAGPILRAGEVVPQLDAKPQPGLENLVFGVRRILAGLFLKVVLADNIAPLVDAGFAFPPETLSALDVWTLAFLFGLQIYFDFSAYSHIAIGSARLMGIRFPENFNFPYSSRSPREFWKRWHISLSSWIRDYLYLPLAGARVHDRSTGGLAEAAEARPVPMKKTRALFLTWAIMGLWHGAAWTFVIWGLWHALVIYLSRKLVALQVIIPRSTGSFAGWFLTLSAIMLGWIPFRAGSLESTLIMVSKVLDPRQYFSLGLRENVYLITATLFLLVIIAYPVQKVVLPWLRTRPVIAIPLETATFAVMVGLVFIFLRPIQQFIYFQF